MTSLNPVNLCGQLIFYRQLKQGPVPTMARLCTSKHLRDLQIMFSIFIVAVGLIAYLIWPQIRALPTISGTPSWMPIAVAGFTTFAATINWIYQSGNRRIGAIDLFASEISSICRVCLVVDFAQSSTQKYRILKDGNQAFAADHPPIKFNSEENYTPVYDRQLAELQSLTSIVVNAVTAFYTYRKTMMDCLRSISLAVDKNDMLERFDQSIYMQFLMYEGARQAIRELSEFQPDRAESLVNILCSEITLFAFLLENHSNDYKGDRLRLRLGNYQDEVGDLLGQIAQNASQTAWDRARVTSDELKHRCNACSTLFEKPPALP